MKLIDIMKRYNKCILKENAKLRSIYNTLIRECDGADAENECDMSECDGEKKNECDGEKKNECDGEKKNECDGKKMSVAEFLGECDKDDTAENECDACGDDSCKDGEKCGLKEGEEDADAEKEQIDEVNDSDLMTAEEFFGQPKKDAGEETGTDECDACGDDSCKDGEKCGLKEGEEKDEEEIGEDEELISKKEFYATNEDEEEIEEDEEEDEEEIGEDDEEEVTESKKKAEEKDGKEDGKEEKLSESLEKHYREANRKLFNF